jgi:hypothetical protein
MRAYGVYYRSIILFNKFFLSHTKNKDHLKLKRTIFHWRAFSLTLSSYNENDVTSKYKHDLAIPFLWNHKLVMVCVSQIKLSTMIESCLTKEIYTDTTIFNSVINATDAMGQILSCPCKISIKTILIFKHEWDIYYNN